MCVFLVQFPTGELLNSVSVVCPKKKLASSYFMEYLLRFEKTKIGSMVSAALVSTLVGLAVSNLGIIPFEAPTFSFQWFLLPMAVLDPCLKQICDVSCTQLGHYCSLSCLDQV